jgi:hypothetical protein
MQCHQPFFEVEFILVPRDTIDARSSVTLEGSKALFQAVEVNMME